ncbi:2-amino-4-hydroxy-6-hydroxymethyldihydropteridine diphosphokinase [Rhodothalassium salexigens]|nr:2-amino-4-hydroxy-6-hydroxymethyldihydropteridine diphosphokinase [Rhodothalassium salexigens]MBK5912312.1 2-amino-4-hydroxy-6-hydroxymethyldihydropteridine diphosphokinase [Rhodothalassium salexigens]MBK5920267.1 2-amino-4-hydroxy-6-hydroxymethyldihydropteridine diphosphokinase [Rhodothalassium salexigens]
MDAETPPTSALPGKRLPPAWQVFPVSHRYQNDEAVAFVALGANLPSAHGSAADTLAAAVATLAGRGFDLVGQSSLYESAPVPPSDQPPFRNAVIALRTGLAPDRVLAALHEVERGFGRTRTVRWEARLLDLDLIAHGARVLPDRAGWQRLAAMPDHSPAPTDDARPCVPHPRAHLRRFVLAPLAEIAPDWRHPVWGARADALPGFAARDQHCRRLAWAPGASGG